MEITGELLKQIEDYVIERGLPLWDGRIKNIYRGYYFAVKSEELPCAFVRTELEDFSLASSGNYDVRARLVVEIFGIGRDKTAKRRAEEHLEFNEIVSNVAAGLLKNLSYIVLAVAGARMYPLNNARVMVDYGGAGDIKGVSLTFSFAFRVSKN